ncbi:unnamed protein product [Strongylus vulgaris]|uniref:Uncharacterized protein n=1 Tax=Strongylus vulgaris TaxID=40348 RepID=A0A3P7LF54_STRVU|nr:unnamed protein product [Strongylus vulgaris]
MPFLGKYRYPKAGLRNGQSFFCLSLSSKFLEDVAQYMLCAQVNVYKKNLPEYFKNIAPSLARVVDRKHRLSPVTNTTIGGMQTSGGKKLKAFSKSKTFGKDLWYDLIAMNLKVPMSVETWRNGHAEDIGSSCDKAVPFRNNYAGDRHPQLAVRNAVIAARSIVLSRLAEQA